MRKLILVFVFLLAISFVFAAEGKNYDEMSLVEQDGISTYTSTGDGKVSLEINGKTEHYWDLANNSYLKTANGSVLEADLTASKETTWKFGNDTLTVEAGTRVFYKDGKIEIFGKENQEFRIDKDRVSEIIRLRNERRIQVNGDIVTGDFDIDIKGDFVNINGSAILIPLTLSEMDHTSKKILVKEGSTVNYKGMNINILKLGVGDFGVYFPLEETYSIGPSDNCLQIEKEMKIIRCGDSSQIKVNFNQPNDFINLDKDSKLSFIMKDDVSLFLDGNSQIAISGDTKFEVTELNGKSKIIYSESGFKKSLSQENDFSVDLDRLINYGGRQMHFSNKDFYNLGEIMTVGKHTSWAYSDTTDSASEFLIKLKELEKKYPDITARDEILALFYDRYSKSWTFNPDVKRDISAINIKDLLAYISDSQEEDQTVMSKVSSKFIGERDSKLSVADLKNSGLVMPTHVTLPDGKSVKIVHVIAGLAGHISGRENAKERGDSEKEGIKEGALLAYAITEGGNLFEVWRVAKEEDKSKVSKIKLFLKEYNRDDERGAYPLSQKTAALWSAKAKRLIGKYDKLSDLIKAIYEQNGYKIE